MEEKVPKEAASLAALLMASPEEAVGYKLGIALDDAQLLTFFPPAGRRSKRFDGSFSEAPFFRLRPFEPPRIPIIGRYAVASSTRPVDSCPLRLRYRWACLSSFAFAATRSGCGESRPYCPSRS